jgi:hypothetical protein
MLVAPAASATPAGMPDQPQVSNMGYCSAQLAQLDGAMGLAPTARAEVNQVIRLYGEAFGLGSPGELYSVRARTPVAEDPVCQRR